MSTWNWTGTTHNLGDDTTTPDSGQVETTGSPNERTEARALAAATYAGESPRRIVTNIEVTPAS